MFQFVIDLVFPVFTAVEMFASTSAFKEKRFFKWPAFNCTSGQKCVGNLESLMHSYAVNAHRSLLCLSWL